MNSILCLVLVTCLIGCGLAADDKKVADKKDDYRRVDEKPDEERKYEKKPVEARRVEEKPVEFPTVEGYTSMFEYKKVIVL